SDPVHPSRPCHVFHGIFALAHPLALREVREHSCEYQGKLRGAPAVDLRVLHSCRRCVRAQLWRNSGMIHCVRTYGSNSSSASPTSGVLTSLFLTFQHCGFENGEGFQDGRRRLSSASMTVKKGVFIPRGRSQKYPFYQARAYSIHRNMCTLRPSLI